MFPATRNTKLPAIKVDVIANKRTRMRFIYFFDMAIQMTYKQKYIKLCLYPSVTENVESNDHCDDAGVVVVVVFNDQISLIVSIILLVAISFLAPVILLFNRNVAVMGQV